MGIGHRLPGGASHAAGPGVVRVGRGPDAGRGCAVAKHALDADTTDPEGGI